MDLVSRFESHVRALVEIDRELRNMIAMYDKPADPGKALRFPKEMKKEDVDLMTAAHEELVNEKRSIMDRLKGMRTFVDMQLQR